MNGLRTLAILLLLAVFAPPLRAEDPGTVRLLYVGDIMLADTPGKVVARGDDPLAPFADVLRDADFRIANLECVISTRGAPTRKPFTFQAVPRCAPLLAKHFDAVSLANNHTGDFGHEAFLEQLDLLKAANLRHFGGGANRKEAHRPLMVELKGIRIALLGYDEFPPKWLAATDDAPGVAWSFDDRVVEDIVNARKIEHADLVIPFMHWGHEGQPGPDARQTSLAHKMIEAGADAVVGGHPHCTQGTEVYRGKLIVYSLGNFIFDGFDKPETTTGWVLRLTLNKQGLVKWDTVVAEMDKEGIPHPNLKAKSPQGTMEPVKE